MGPLPILREPEECGVSSMVHLGELQGLQGLWPETLCGGCGVRICEQNLLPSTIPFIIIYTETLDDKKLPAFLQSIIIHIFG